MTTIKNKLILVGGILALSASLQAGTSLVITGAGTNPDASYLSPYSGTISSSSSLSGSVTLICDDYNDEAKLNTSYNVVVTNVGTGTINSTDSRFGGAAGYPAATTLYDEMVWLAAQLVATTGTNWANNQAEIQEAIWQLSDPKNNGGSSSLGSPTTTYGAESQTYLQWEADAKYAITGVGAYTAGTTAASYLTPDYSAWYIVTDTNAAGCSYGGGYHCSGSASQEFLAYSTPSGPHSTTTAVTGTPEPASFVLIGTGLLAGAFFGRRRTRK
jgi:hypothetical protein